MASLVFPSVLQLQEERAALSNRLSTLKARSTSELEQEAKKREAEGTKSLYEVDRLLDIMKTLENDKVDKDKQISELQEWVVDSAPSWVCVVPLCDGPGAFNQVSAVRFTGSWGSIGRRRAP